LHRDAGAAFTEREISDAFSFERNVKLRAKVQTLGDAALD
jgi:hypothetical protein